MLFNNQNFVPVTDELSPMVCTNFLEKSSTIYSADYAKNIALWTYLLTLTEKELTGAVPTAVRGFLIAAILKLTLGTTIFAQLTTIV